MDTLDVKVASYLAGLDIKACMEFCKQVGLDFYDVTPFVFEDASQVEDCLVSFINRGVSAEYLLLNVNVWAMYLHSLTEERFHKGIDLMLSTQDPASIMYFFRACYRFGMPAIEDSVSDIFETVYSITFPRLSFLKTTSYDDDEYDSLVLDAVAMCSAKRTAPRSQKADNGQATVRQMDLTSKEYTDLNSEKSRSIRPVVTSEEAFEFWCNAPMCRVHFSLKIDGVNTKMSFSDKDGEGLTLALSRGRAANSIDYTQAIKNMFKCKSVQDSLLSGKVTGESFVGLGDLKIIQAKYQNKDYKTPKSTAMAMLRAPDNFDARDYGLLSFCAFDYQGLPPDVAFQKLQDAGLTTPPALEFAGEEIPRTSLEDFNTWMMENVLDPLWVQGATLGIGSDGVVMYLLADITTERKDQYSDSNIAIKYHHWAAATYRSRVTGIVFEQRRVEASIVLVLEPVVTRDGNTATRAGVGSPDILISDGVKIGDLVLFERKSEAYNVYLGKVAE